MASILDLPPEIIDLIIPNLRTSVGEQQQYRRVLLANGSQLLCSCCDDERVSEQFFGHNGPHSFGDARNLVRFEKTHPYIMKCVAQSRYCDIVTAWATGQGVALLSCSGPTSPSSVR
jgi:hypothetical protein